ncbi:hypothetical protein BJ508DRAFT_334993 [Ascobolus immersus RN42]|uniref:Uncharacterized protein n=1 Tax=Ascobolus immersus RN42 TaxID=1160509 RepID=A0A3N4HG13_ASCIM|nr:hypothetical protein BJ508DRAFT_334993 [Ascobolus immersus RN42]
MPCSDAAHDHEPHNATPWEERKDETQLIHSCEHICGNCFTTFKKSSRRGAYPLLRHVKTNAQCPKKPEGVTYERRQKADKCTEKDKDKKYGPEDASLYLKHCLRAVPPDSDYWQLLERRFDYSVEKRKQVAEEEGITFQGEPKIDRQKRKLKRKREIDAEEHVLAVDSDQTVKRRKSKRITPPQTGPAQQTIMAVQRGISEECNDEFSEYDRPEWVEALSQLELPQARITFSKEKRSEKEVEVGTGFLSKNTKGTLDASKRVVEKARINTTGMSSTSELPVLRPHNATGHGENPCGTVGHSGHELKPRGDVNIEGQSDTESSAGIKTVGLSVISTSEVPVRCVTGSGEASSVLPLAASVIGHSAAGEIKLGSKVMVDKQTGTGTEGGGIKAMGLETTRSAVRGLPEHDVTVSREDSSVVPLASSVIGYSESNEIRLGRKVMVDRKTGTDGAGAEAVVPVDIVSTTDLSVRDVTGKGGTSIFEASRKLLGVEQIEDTEPEPSREGTVAGQLGPAAVHDIHDGQDTGSIPSANGEGSKGNGEESELVITLADHSLLNVRVSSTVMESASVPGGDIDSVQSGEHVHGAVDADEASSGPLDEDLDPARVLDAIRRLANDPQFGTELVAILMDLFQRHLSELDFHAMVSKLMELRLNANRVES